MNELQETAVLLKLSQELVSLGSWCGETHVQKSMYFLQEMSSVPTSFKFILYKHGPFSFDLRDNLASLRADGLLQIKLRPYPYAPSLQPTEGAARFLARFQTTLGRHARSISFVARMLAGEGVAELERLATALYVLKEVGGETPAEARAHYLTELKPHLSLQSAMEAVITVDKYQEEANQLLA